MNAQLNAIENEMSDFDFKSLQAATDQAKANIASATTAGDVNK